jgi:hypothetical protein
MIDFSIPGPLYSAILVVVLLPLPLWLITRLSAMTERNPLQFLFAVFAVLIAWGVATICVPVFRSTDLPDWIVGFMAISGAALVYLEIWGLMSRGYTLSILATLLEADVPLTDDEIAKNYRGGDGLDWILRHRLGGLEGSGMIKRRDGYVYLASPRGFLIARLYKICVWVLGLRRTG